MNATDFDVNLYKAQTYLSLDTIITKHNRYSGREDDFQITCTTVLNLLEKELKTTINWFHVANERKTKVQFDKRGNSFSAGGNLLKAYTCKKGVSDVWIMKPVGKYAGLIIELKSKYNKPNEFQHEWLHNLNSVGYLAVWVNSIDELFEVLNYYFLPLNPKTNKKIL